MSITDENKLLYLDNLKTYLSSYSVISQTSFELIKSLIKFQQLSKNEILIVEGEIARNIYFLAIGAIRAYSSDADGHTYNKNLFLKNRMVGSMVSSLLQKPSTFTLQALDECTLLSINFSNFKQLINQNEDLKNYYIAYLEKDWVIAKEQREVSLVMDNAAIRYHKLQAEHPDIDQQISLHHIASHLGITPTQLSRIRKALKAQQNQHM
ncbi:Crp/Fnr family transcriptional regulator [Pedobacter xixiisoli]|uniref:cAMP-binding domain of CRP or a regulatory subunit of cAMP-dependent protein kinases n=1 Tax=Pedobacter xixiisoli TaxID=1476464 RepID=A0A285ZTP4_9SPHI|nr:cyclic nucleotide-binding domain-containing protein [Pedobacter xixiisoli]SOD13006.1 cAMP-binding domain of CRP or a regulatory subunit of cAMP-dependent protein kinases [Pedobacter xixiisoli]